MIFFIAENTWLQFVPVTIFALYAVVAIKLVPNNNLALSPWILFLLRVVIAITGLVTILAVISVWFLAFAWIPGLNLILAIITYWSLARHHAKLLGAQGIPQKRNMSTLLISALTVMAFLYILSLYYV